MMASLIRSLTLSAALGGLVFVGYWWLRSSTQQWAINELQTLNREMEERLAQREKMIDRLSRTRRIGHIRITDQTPPPEMTAGNRESAIGADGSRLPDRASPFTTGLEFIELDEDGSEIARQQFRIPGDVLFVDAWTIKFDPEMVAIGGGPGGLRGKSLVLLKRIYSDQMQPREGFPIDTPGSTPPGYAAEEMGRFEAQLWKQFWQIATDPVLAKNMGVRVAQGEAVYKQVREGQQFELVVDAAGGMSLTPLGPDEKDHRVSRADE